MPICAMYKHSAQMWHGRLWIVAGQMYNLNRGGWYIAVTGSGIEISLENYSNSRFLLLELPLCYSDRQRTLLKLWFPTMEQKIFLVPGSDSQAPQSCLLKLKIIPNKAKGQNPRVKNCLKWILSVWGGGGWPMPSFVGLFASCNTPQNDTTKKSVFSYAGNFTLYTGWTSIASRLASLFFSG